MRLAPIGFGAVLAMVPAIAMAADAVRRTAVPAPTYVEPRQPVSFVSELRIGGSAHDPWSPEKGSVNLTGEVLFAKPFTSADLITNYFIPRPHIGGSINFDGHTSFAYAGLTWTVDITSRFFVEATFGGAVHDGNTSSNPALVPIDRNALGCSPLFRESASVGFRINANWSVMATVEHLSNAGLCSQNRGLTNVGAKIGYTF